jgi:gliding motility-associated-like protein
MMRLLSNLFIKSLCTCLFVSLILSTAFAQLNVSTALTTQQLVQNVLVGSGVTITNITYSGVPGSMGEFSNGNTTNLGLDHGIIISTGLVNGNPAIGSAAMNFASTDNQTGADPQLQNLVTDPVLDAAVLEFDFIPISDTLKFRYVFGSEEYPEFVNAGYNDVFGFFVSGPNPLGGNYINNNIARIPGTTLPVSIDNVNGGSYSQYYVDNGTGTTIVYDGFTTVLTAWVKVVPCQQYHIKIAIGDVGDHVYDSGVFLEANSFSSNGLSYNVSYSLNVDTAAIEGCNNAIVKFRLSQPAVAPLIIHYTISGTAIEGVDYPNVPDSLIIPAGQDSAFFIILPIADGLVEPVESVKIAYVNTVCGTIDTIKIWIKDYIPLQTSTTPDVHSCNGQDANISVNASGGFNPLSYIWSNSAGNTASVFVNPPIPTMYYVSVSDACNYLAIDSVKVSISNLSNTISNVDSISCFGYSDGSATITAANGLPPYTYIWSPSNAVTATSANLSAGTYFVTVTDVIGCTSTNFVILSSPPQITLSLTPTDETCLGSCNGQISTQLTGNYLPPVTYNWSSVPPQTTQDLIDTCAGSYTVTVTYSSNNCQLVESATIGTATLINAYFSTNPDPPQGFVPFTMNFNSTGTTGAATYSWDFGDGTPFSTDLNPTHDYTAMGNYTVTLTVNSGAPNNCISTYQMVIQAIQPSSMSVPNVFTPNGDGKNDQFSIEAEGIQTVNIEIFNRWGKKIYDMNANDFAVVKETKPVWDGTSRSEGKCATGTYFYIINAVGYDKKEYTLQGTINLMR